MFKQESQVQALQDKLKFSNCKNKNDHYKNYEKRETSYNHSSREEISKTNKVE